MSWHPPKTRTGQTQKERQKLDILRRITDEKLRSFLANLYPTNESSMLWTRAAHCARNNDWTFEELKQQPLSHLLEQPNLGKKSAHFLYAALHGSVPTKPKKEKKQAQSASLPMVFTIQGAAAALSVGRSTIYKMLDGGELSSIKIGKRRMIPRHALEKIAQSGAVLK